MKVINNVGLHQAVYQIISTIESTVWRIKVEVTCYGLFFRRSDLMNEASCFLILHIAMRLNFIGSISDKILS